MGSRPGVIACLCGAILTMAAVVSPVSGQSPSQPQAKKKAPPLVFRQPAAKAAYDRGAAILAFTILCRLPEPAATRFRERAGAVVSRLEGVAAAAKLSNGQTASSSLMIDGWTESWMISMGSGKSRAPNCTTFGSDFARMKINQANWRVEDGLR